MAPGAARALEVIGTVASPIADRSEIRLRARLENDQTPAVALGGVELVVRSRPRFTATGSSLAYPAGDALRPGAAGQIAIVVANEGTDAARDVRLQLEITPEARIEAVDGATRVGGALLFGDVLAGGRAEATVRLRLAPRVTRGTTITAGGKLEAVGLLPFALAPVTIPTVAEPRFDDGASLRTQPGDSVDAGEALFLRLAVRNTGDGAASRLVVHGQLPAHTAYLPGSTLVNDVPLLDVDGGSVVWSKHGLVLEDVDPGIEVVVRTCVIVNTPLPAGTLITAQADLAWDGGGSLAVTAPAVRVRSAPAFAVRAHGLPFSVSGIAPRTIDVLREVAEQRRGATAVPAAPALHALPPAEPEAPAFTAPERAPYRRDDEAIEARFIPAPPEPSFVAPEPVQAEAVVVVPEPAPRVRLEFGREALERALAFLDQAEHGGLITHLFAVRTLVPTDLPGVRGEAGAKLTAAREALQSVVNRLWIKLRMPRYALTAKDLEDRPSRSALIELVQALGTASLVPDATKSEAAVVLEGAFVPERVARHLAALESEPLGSALPWLVLAELLPATLVAAPANGALAAYRTALIATFTSAATLPIDEFHRVLAATENRDLDAALREVRAALREALEATAARA